MLLLWSLLYVVLILITCLYLHIESQNTPVHIFWIVMIPFDVYLGVLKFVISIFLWLLKSFNFYVTTVIILLLCILTL